MRKVKDKRVPGEGAGSNSAEDIYKGIHPELVVIAKAQGVGPFKYDAKRNAAFLRDPKTWEGFEEYIDKLRHGW